MKNKNYCKYFKDKKITIMGLGILGRGVNVAKFLAECGADLTITDLKNAEQLKPSLKKLAKFKNIKYTLGKHEFADFKDKDFIIKAGGIPLDSSYIAEAKKNRIAIEMDESLFCKLAKGVIIIGITGTKGKSAVSKLIFEIIKTDFSVSKNKRKVFMGGNVLGHATLPLLKKISLHDVVVMELDSWRLQGFHDAKINPHISVFTNFMPDHMNYYGGDIRRYFEDKANIFKYQKEGDALVLGENFLKTVKKYGIYNSIDELKKDVKGKIIIATKKNIPRDWKIKVLGVHNLENIATAIEAVRCFGVKESIIRKVVEDFKGIPGRLEFIREVKRIKFYNDTTATTPDAGIVALESLKKHKGKIILIAGGADKDLDYRKYVKIVKNYVKVLILFRGAASDKIIKELGQKLLPQVFSGVSSMKEAFVRVKKFAKYGDIVLLSPGAASFGVFKNEFDRGRQFNKLVKRI